MEVKELFGFLNEDSRLRGVEVGSIEIERDYTTFEVDEKFKDQVMNLFSDADVDGEEVEIVCEETGILSTRPQKTKRGKNRRRRNGGSRRRRKY